MLEGSLPLSIFAVYVSTIILAFNVAAYYSNARFLRVILSNAEKGYEGSPFGLTGNSWPPRVWKGEGSLKTFGPINRAATAPKFVTGSLPRLTIPFQITSRMAVPNKFSAAFR
jgi:hypothetical protein